MSQNLSMPAVPDAKPRRRHVQWRGVIAGVALTTIINALDPISGSLVHSSSFTNSHLPFALLLGVLLLAYVYNPIIRLTRPAWVMRTTDLASVLAIGFLGTTVPMLANRFIAVISAPDYFASPENEWPTYTIPNLQRWLLPSNEGGGIAQFYQGLGSGQEAPWSIWLGPLFWWSSLLIAIMAACFFLSVILRKQWSERERLAFPLVEVPMMLVQENEDGGSFPTFFRDRLFWIGFSIPAFILLWNTAGHFNELLPVFSFLNNNNLVEIGRGFPPLFFRFDIYVMCFAYFTTLEVLLSMWVFGLIATLQVGIMERIGLGGATEVGNQSYYGLIVFVFWGLWTARSQFHDVWRKAVGSAPDVDDSEELVSYRAAGFGFLMVSVFIFFWLLQAGLGTLTSVAFMISTLVLYLGMAKIVCLSGLVSLRGTGPSIMAKVWVGIQNMSQGNIASINQMGALYGNGKGFAMPGVANSVKAAEHAENRRRRLGGGILAGGALSLVAFMAVTLILGYFGPGAENFGDYSYTDGNRHFYNATVSNIKDGPTTVREWKPYGFGLAGATITLILILLNQRFPWWPLHPVGFTVSLQYPTRASFLSLIIAWLAKSIIIRLGGMERFNRSRTFVYGALMGYSLGVTVSFILDVIFFMGNGHALHTPPM